MCSRRASTSGSGVRGNGREEEGLRVRVARRLVDGLPVGANSTIFPEVHDGNAVEMCRTTGEIVGDEEVREAELPLEVLEKVDDLRLNRARRARTPARRRRSARLERESPRDSDPLALATVNSRGYRRPSWRKETNLTEQLPDAGFLGGRPRG